MTKKNTRSDSHKHIKATLCAAMCSVLTAMPAFATGEDNSAAAAGTTVWTKASEIMQDVYSQIISISTVTAVEIEMMCGRCPAADEFFQKRQDSGRFPRVAQAHCHHLGDSERSWLHHGLRHAVLSGRHLESVTTPLLTKGGDGLWAF